METSSMGVFLMEIKTIIGIKCEKPQNIVWEHIAMHYSSC